MTTMLSSIRNYLHKLSLVNQSDNSLGDLDNELKTRVVVASIGGISVAIREPISDPFSTIDASNRVLGAEVAPKK